MRVLIVLAITSALLLGGGSLASAISFCGVGKEDAHASIQNQVAPGASEWGNFGRANPSTGALPPGNGGFLDECTDHKGKKPKR
jgi:hypothetical protein